MAGDHQLNLGNIKDRPTMYGYWYGTACGSSIVFSLIVASFFPVYNRLMVFLVNEDHNNPN